MAILVVIKLGVLMTEVARGLPECSVTNAGEGVTNLDPAHPMVMSLARGQPRFAMCSGARARYR